MLDGLLKWAEIGQAVSLLAPGLLILSIRSAVQSGPRPELRDSLLRYAAVSAIYYSFFYPIFHWEGGIQLNYQLWSGLQYFGLPIAVGLLAAYEVQGEWFYRVARKFRLYIAHQIPTAWDAAFSRLRSGTFVLVTLKDGAQVAGLMGRRSFASSSREERDLLLEEVWIVSRSGSWAKASPSRSILLCGGDIRHVEVFEEIADGQTA